VGGYGQGFGQFAVVPLPGRTGSRVVDSARSAEVVPIELPRGTAYQIGAGMLTALVMQRRRGQILLLTGFVTADVLRSAAGELSQVPVR
jgi:hypothetical protein